MNDFEEAFEINVDDEIDAIEQCFARVNTLTKESATYFVDLDKESWSLVQFWRYFHSGLNARRCIVAGFINGSNTNLQIKSVGLVEGASPCYQIPTNDYDESQGLLRPGAAIIFFAWGMPPTLNHVGNVNMNIETNLFSSSLDIRKAQPVTMTVLPQYHVEFLERSYDESQWWAKYWVLISNNGASRLMRKTV